MRVRLSIVMSLVIQIILTVIAKPPNTDFAADAIQEPLAHCL